MSRIHSQEEKKGRKLQLKLGVKFFLVEFLLTFDSWNWPLVNGQIMNLRSIFYSFSLHLMRGKKEKQRRKDEKKRFHSKTNIVFFSFSLFPKSNKNSRPRAKKWEKRFFLIWKKFSKSHQLQIFPRDFFFLENVFRFFPGKFVSFWQNPKLVDVALIHFWQSCIYGCKCEC